MFAQCYHCLHLEIHVNALSHKLMLEMEMEWKELLVLEYFLEHHYLFWLCLLISLSRLVNRTIAKGYEMFRIRHPGLVHYYHTRDGLWNSAKSANR